MAASEQTIDGYFEYVLFDTGSKLLPIITGESRGRGGRGVVQRQRPHPVDFWRAFESEGELVRSLSFWENGGYTTIEGPRYSGQGDPDYPDGGDVDEITASFPTEGSILLEYADREVGLTSCLGDFCVLKPLLYSVSESGALVYDMKTLTLSSGKRILVFRMEL